MEGLFLALDWQIDISSEKSFGGGGGRVGVGILVSAPVPFLWTLDFGT